MGRFVLWYGVVCKDATHCPDCYQGQWDRPYNFKINSVRLSSVFNWNFLRNRYLAVFTLSGEMFKIPAISLIDMLSFINAHSFKSLGLISGYASLIF